jgi:hypothetical protein
VGIGVVERDGIGTGVREREGGPRSLWVPSLFSIGSGGIEVDGETRKEKGHQIGLGWGTVDVIRYTHSLMCRVSTTF